jgi:PAS domain S-box-containing protein
MSGKTSFDTAEDRYRILLESTPLVPWEVDARTWLFNYVGPQAIHLLGYPVEDWYGATFWADRIHPDDRDAAVSTCERLSREGKDYELEYRMIRADGTIAWIHDVVSVEMENGEPALLRGFLIDVTARKETEAALARSESRFAELMEAAPDAMIAVREDGSIAVANSQAEELFGYARDELKNLAIEQLVPERHRERHVAHRATFDQEPARRSMGSGLVLTALHRTGAEIPVEISLNPIQTDEGVLVFSSIRDVTDKREAQDRLSESERRLRLMADSLPALIAYVDAEQRYGFGNRAYAEWHEIPPSEIIGRKLRDVVGEELYQAIEPHVETVLTGETVTHQTWVPHRDGSRRRIHASYVPHTTESGEVLGFFALVRDTTEQFLAEEKARRNRDELAHVLRVATMGELATSMAHELNQPLSAIAANSQAARRFLAAEQPNTEEASDALTDITSDAKRAGNIIRRMRDLLMKRQLQREPVDMNEAISNVAGLLHSDAVSRQVTVTLDLADKLPATFGDRTQLAQVILNLMVNAFEAMTSSEIDRRELVVRTSVGDAGSAEITVSDTGPGFHPGRPDYVFEPFVTTKANGLGMGLSISRSIINAHGGRLEAVHNPHGGATLRITLPAGGEDS